jgi:UDP-N-acetylmuramoyl-L-alanyl-D-glutamate--2,6-diaminopimelate ligase
MRLDQIIQKANIKVLERGNGGNPDVTDVVCDSRTATPGALFVAVPGTKMPGDSFIAAAVANGAGAVVSENAPSNCPVPWIKVDNARRSLGEFAKALWSVDLDKIVTVGITGTNGKTTTAHLFTTLCGQRFQPSRVWMFGTIDYLIGGVRSSASHTTPEAHDIFRFVGRAAECPAAIVMEASSHALALDRVGGMAYDVAILTNVTQDHLDFHKTMEQYYRAKSRLFTDFLKPNGMRVVNSDDEWGARLAEELGGKNLITYGRAPNADVRIVNWECTWDGTRVELSVGGRAASIESKLRGFFNVYNMTALYAGALALSFDQASIERAFAAVETVPGRMDRVPLDAPFAVIVDYAHTPDALVNILQTSRSLTKGRLFCVFGCGGDRDRTKRPIMGGAVARLADEAIVTSDNPRSEEPSAIIDEIVKGMPLDFPYQVIADRATAIKKALQMARSGDCIVIAGKGHEDYQEIKGVKHHFDDRETVLETYGKMGA